MKMFGDHGKDTSLVSKYVRDVFCKYDDDDSGELSYEGLVSHYLAGNRATVDFED